MTSDLATVAEHSSDTPTEDAPEVGCIIVGTVCISDVEHWINEDGLHVFRSVDFDCSGEDEDLWQAGRVFIENAEDLGRFLADLVDAGRATKDEQRVLVTLAQRFFDVYQESEREEERRRWKRRLFSRSRGAHSAKWQRRPALKTSSQPLPV